MGSIDIGPGATNRANYADAATYISKGNPANDTGTLTSVEIWANSDLSAYVGTFSGSSTTYTNRDYANIGAVTSGSKQTFTGLDIDVETDDLLGEYHTGGNIESSDSGDSGYLRKTSNQMGTGSQSYTNYNGRATSIYATGATLGWANIIAINGIASADIATVNGIAVADIAKINGVAV